jgi:RNA polymerase sigma-70 factor (ECF subfamily)
MTEKEILEKFRANDPAAWNKVYNMFYRMVWYMISKDVPNHADAEELANDVFLRIKDKCSRIETMDELKAFLLMVTINMVKDYFKKQKTRKIIKTEEYDAIEESLNDYEKNKFYENNTEKTELALREIYKQPEQRQNVILLLLEGLTTKQIAEKLGISESTVYNHKAAAIKDLKEKLGDQFRNFGLLLLLVLFLQSLLH